MNYIVFDLEWNQNPAGKKSRNDRLPFEIIEIGAVKVKETKPSFSFALMESLVSCSRELTVLITRAETAAHIMSCPSSA